MVVLVSGGAWCMVVLVYGHTMVVLVYGGAGVWW
jgi:hypothetical protein